MDYRDKSKIKFSARYGAEAETIGAAGGHTGDGTEETGGLVDSIIFRNNENGYTVLLIEGPDGDPVTLAGIIPYVNEGDRILARGSWVNHKKYGRQFEVVTYEKQLPAEEGDILRYLASGAVKGIGPKTAAKIIEKFGTDSFEVIESHPEWLADIPGISPKKAQAISKNFIEISGSREFMMFSRDFFSTATAVRVYKKWGAGAVERIKSDPYSLVGEFSGIGFRRADMIAASLGLPADSPSRIRAGIRYVLSTEAGRNGHTCLPEDTLIDCAGDLLFSEDEPQPAVIKESLEELIGAGDVIPCLADGVKYIFPLNAYRAENGVAKRLTRLGRTCASFDRGDVDSMIRSCEIFSGIKYADMQREALRAAMENGVMVLTGGPGTGKTTITKGILHIFENMDQSVALAAPTGRAAKRMSEATSHEAKTIHRLLEMEYSDDDNAHFLRNENNPLDEKVVIIDEASMVDVFLMDALVRALRAGTRLILIGDSDQLPSVGCGNVLDDVISSGVFRVIRLTEIFRQSEESRITLNAHLINCGKMPDLKAKGTDFFFLGRDGDREIADTVSSLVSERLPKAYGRRAAGAQVISPSRKGAAGTESLNVTLRSLINPPSPDKAEYRSRGIVFRVGDKVMQTKNNYSVEWTDSFENKGVGVFNGDIGTITEIDGADESLTVAFDDRICVYDYQMCEELEHAYAITVHKSQGSEYPIVIVPLYSCPPMLRTRNMIYTAITRASEMVILVGRRDILAEMIENDRKRERCTMLRRMLKAENRDEE